MDGTAGLIGLYVLGFLGALVVLPAAVVAAWRALAARRRARANPYTVAPSSHASPRGRHA